jgi:hypothetical protein
VPAPGDQLERVAAFLGAGLDGDAALDGRLAAFAQQRLRLVAPLAGIKQRQLG